MYKSMYWIPHVQGKTLTEFQRNGIQTEDMAVAVNFHLLFGSRPTNLTRPPPSAYCVFSTLESQKILGTDPLGISATGPMKDLRFPAGNIFPFFCLNDSRRWRNSGSALTPFRFKPKVFLCQCWISPEIQFMLPCISFCLPEFLVIPLTQSILGIIGT